MTTLRETCSCGARLRVSGASVGSIAANWRRDHPCPNRRDRDGWPRPRSSQPANLETRVRRAVEALDNADVPVQAGRPTARQALRDAGVPVRNDALGEAIRRRKDRT